VPKDERNALVTELFDIVIGNVKDFVFKHDSVRVVQCAVKYANVEQKKEIAKELQGSYKELAESRYAKFLVAKLMVEDKETREMIVSEFYGSVKKLINHPEASWILDDTYRQVATPKQKAIILREWYGPEYVLENKKLASSPSTAPSDISADLVTILAANPDKRKPILDHLYQQINGLVQKKMTGFTMLHDAMLQYSLTIPENDTSTLTTWLDLLKPAEEEDTDLLKNLAFTSSGARLVRRALAFSSAKDRKALLKPYKDHVEMLAFDPHGHTILLAAMEVIDDTVLTSKFIFPTLVAANKTSAQDRAQYISEMAHHLTARIVLLYPLLPTSTSTTSTNTTRWLIQPDSPTALALSELHTLRAFLGTSKKDPAVRHQELTRALLTQSDNALLTTIPLLASKLAETSFGCQMMQEILLSAPSALNTSGASHPQITAAMAAIADLASGDPSASTHIANSAFGGRMLKTLVSGARFDPSSKTAVAIEPALGFADVLFERIKGHLGAWATGASSFVVANLFEETSGLDISKRKEAIRLLAKERKNLEEAKGKGNKGAGLVLEVLD